MRATKSIVIDTERLRELRHSRCMTQLSLSIDTSLALSNLSRIEALDAYAVVQSYTADRLCAALDCPLTDIRAQFTPLYMRKRLHPP